MRFAYAVDVPRSYRAGREPDNGDGQKFTSPDGNVAIHVYGHYPAPGAKDRLGADYASSLLFARESGRVTYAVRRDGFFAISWRKGARIVYQKTVPLIEYGTGTVELDYPAARRREVDPILRRVTRSLKALSRS